MVTGVSMQEREDMFLESKASPKVIYTDNPLELGNTCEDHQWKQCTLTPHRSETNVIAERAARWVK